MTLIQKWSKQMPLAIITFLNPDGSPVDPGYGVGGTPVYPSGGPVFPGRPTDPGYGRPSIPGSIGTLPVFPFDPTRPDNTLPGPTPTPTPPIQLHPGLKLVVKYMACHGFIAVPDNELPSTPEPK
jgi:hypothetical protein